MSKNEDLNENQIRHSKAIASEVITNKVPEMIELAVVKAMQPISLKLERIVTALETQAKSNTSWVGWLTKTIGPALISIGVVMGTLYANGVIK